MVKYNYKYLIIMYRMSFKNNVNILKSYKHRANLNNDKIDSIISLYEDKKIPNIKTAEKAVKLLSSKHKASSKKALDNFNEIYNKYIDAEPMTGRLSRPNFVTISKHNINKPESSINFNIITSNYNRFDNHIDGAEKMSFEEVFKKIKLKVIKEITNMLIIKKSMLIRLGVNFEVAKLNIDPFQDDNYIFKANDYTSEHKIVILSTKYQECTKANIKNIINEQYKEINNIFDKNAYTDGSNWIIYRWNFLFYNCLTIKPKRGSSYIPTPLKYANPNCGLINIQNKDQQCFRWCMKYHQAGKVVHGERTSVLEKIEDKYNYNNISYPTSFEDINKFELDNEVSIFVYYVNDDDSIRTEKIGNKDYILKDVIYLLRIENEDNSHYVYIKHIERLFNRHVNSKTVGTKLCPLCEKDIKEKDYRNHVSICYKFCKEGTIIKLPEEGSKMKFVNYKNKLERPYIVYADMECTLEKTNNINNIHNHIPNSCCFYFVCTYDSTQNVLWHDIGNNCVENMILELNKLSYNCINKMKHNEEMIMNENDMKKAKTQRKCHICNNCFKPDEVKCRDHDHRTGEFRGMAHKKCNINYYNNFYLPIVFHNLRGYDGHFIIKKAYDIIKKMDKEPNIHVIPNSYEKFMSFDIGNLKFIDSFLFMSSSLEKLVENLYNKDPITKYDNFNFMKKEFNKDIDILCQKGFYPYEFIDNIDKLNHEGLPDIDKFYSQLYQKTLTEKEYIHATKVYNQMNCKTFKDYHLLYLKCDVLLLADVFENFRKTCIEYYQLDPSNYISVPGLAWDAMLLMSNIELDLITDLEILEMIEKGKRGGLCYVGSQRHCVANNKYLPDYDNTKPENYLMYWDANNLYGYAMQQMLPFRNIRFNKTIDLDGIKGTPDDNDIGYYPEVDLEFDGEEGEELHEKLKQFVPAPESIAVEETWLSDFQKDLKKQNKINNSKCTKLIPHLNKHEKYVIHYRNLKYLIKLGVKVKKLHRVIEFEQKAWMKPYIETNTEFRTKAKNEFEKDFFKLMNNSVFGKTMQNVKNQMQLHITTDDNNAIKWFSKVNLKDCKYNHGLYMIEMYKKEIIYNKPIYIGVSILDLSKLCMMEFHYEVIEKNFKGKYILLYSDTDSLVYSIEHHDIYEWIKENKNHFDLSESFRDDLKDYINGKVVGKFKDELHCLVMKAWVALNPKVYSYNYQSMTEAHAKLLKDKKIDINIEKENPYSYNIINKIDNNIEEHKLITKNKKTLKGVSKVVVENELKDEDYLKVLQTNKPIEKNVTSIRSFNHNVVTYKQKKIALTSYYDKMYMINGNECVPFGYKHK